MKSKQLREMKAKLVIDARLLSDDVPAGELMTPENNTKFDEMMARVDSYSAEITRVELLDDHESHLNQRIERKAGREGLSNDEAANKIAVDGQAFTAYLKGGMAALSEEHRAIATPRFMNAQSTGSGSAGGYTVPDSFYGQVISAELAFGGMINVAQIIDTDSGSPLQIPTDNDTSNEGAILGENVQTGAQDVSFGSVTLNAQTYSSKLVLVSNQLLQDSGFDMNSFLSGKLGERLARIVNRHCTVGTGASQPTGVVAASTLGITSASATVPTFDEIVFDLVHSVDPAYRQNATYMFNDATLKYLRKLKDGEGEYLWSTSVMEREPDTLAGKKYTINQHMASIGSTNKSVLFGDFKKYFIRRVRGVQVLRLTERYADYNQVGFLAFQRVDGQLVDAGTHPIKHLIG
ncbi:COG4653 Predicted phage phi-C31 gp36 major capsid-like protein [uncultured Caudovirales phage]|uniref:COG4653 Predicted phage phi-C31 gp36 major capsid-like protein n=1 Tax=uncultured Caudovirales phage TaxID=2100421 RepID=A0A6J5RW90_9CAUD|nr:COG4653 Predicted phage phi-C31 gp36 major capsid-like protein [uncultured Caudovirales phage]